MDRKSWLLIGALVVAAIVAGGYFALQRPLAYARIATGYMAQQTCACLFVSGREEASCMADYPADAVSQARLTITHTADRSAVSVSVLHGAFKADAEYDPRYGCRLTS